jgi:chloramphenicol-sensitive protein RarD
MFNPIFRHEQSAHHSGVVAGLFYGISAHLIWGFFPVYFKALVAVPPLQILSHRIVWSMLFIACLVGWRGKARDIRTALSNRRSLALLTVTAILIAINWLVFIIAVEHAQVIQASLGYFITPFVSVLFGFLFLQERLRRMQLLGLSLAAVGVLLLTIRYGHFPWVALILALSFGSYGLLRKIASVDALTGLAVETMLLGPAALSYLIVVACKGQGSFLSLGLQTDALLVLAGIATTVTLLLFASAARRLRLMTMGSLQYITPTMQFLLAVLLYHEAFTQAHLASFAFIWGGLCCYSYDAYQTMQAFRSAHRQSIGT